MTKTRTPEEIEARFKCMDCATDTSKSREYYMVTDEVWLAANPEGKGKLCIGCLESRIGRTLNSGDFPNYPINDLTFYPWRKSERLTNRLRAA